MASGGPYDTNDNDGDIDDDIQRLQIILQDDEAESGEGSDGDLNEELQSLDKNADDEYNSYISRPSTCSDVTASSFPATSTGAEQDDLIYRLDPNNVTAESCLAMNRAYQEVLLDLLRQTEISLIDNRQKQKQLEEDVDGQCSKSDQKRHRKNHFPLLRYTAPYFKDSKGQSPPDNNDVQLKRNLHEEKQHVKPKPPWSKVARKVLLNAVKLNTLEHILRPYFSKMEIEQEKMLKCKNQKEIDTCAERIEALRRTADVNKKLPADMILQLVEPEKIDWMKISLQEFDQRYEPHECEQMWRNVLRPGINRDKWTPDEDARLFDLASKYKQHRWDKIATALRTNRTPFQCLQHFQKSTLVYDQTEWTTLDDELLREVVETCRFGNSLIHWQQVAYYVEGRSSLMCKHRWLQINPELKRGKWSGHEDCMLIAAVQLMGTNDWSKVSQFVGGRSGQQCRERWLNSLDPSVNAGIYSYEEDKLLLKLYSKYGSEWKSISVHMAGRTDSQVMNRYKKLLTWEQHSREFFNEPMEVQENLLSPSFQFVKENGMQRIRLLQFPLYNKKSTNSSKASAEEGWESFAKSIEIDNSDYDKQWRDRVNGDIIVPRPPPMRKYSARSYESTWFRRRNLQVLVQTQINNMLQDTAANRPTDPHAIAQKVATTLAPVADISSGKWNMINCAMQGKQPHEISVRHLLQISRCISDNGEVPTQEDLKHDIIKVPETSVRKPYKQRKKLSEAARVASEARKTKLMEHGLLGDSLRKLVHQKMQRASLMPQRGLRQRRKRRQKFNLFADVPTVKREPGAVETMNRKSLLLMLKSLDVHSDQIYRTAREKHRKIVSAIKPSSHASKRSRLRQSTLKNELTNWGSKSKDVCELVLDMRQDLGITETQESSEEELEETGETNAVKANLKVMNELRRLSYNSDIKFQRQKYPSADGARVKNTGVEVKNHKKGKRGRPRKKKKTIAKSHSETGDVSKDVEKSKRRRGRPRKDKNTVTETHTETGEVHGDVESTSENSESKMQGLEENVSNVENSTRGLEFIVPDNLCVSSTEAKNSNEDRINLPSSETVNNEVIALSSETVEVVQKPDMHSESSRENSHNVENVHKCPGVHTEDSGENTQTVEHSRENSLTGESVHNRTAIYTQNNRENSKTVENMHESTDIEKSTNNSFVPKRTDMHTENSRENLNTFENKLKSTDIENSMDNSMIVENVLKRADMHTENSRENSKIIETNQRTTLNTDNNGESSKSVKDVQRVDSETNDTNSGLVEKNKEPPSGDLPHLALKSRTSDVVANGDSSILDTSIVKIEHIDSDSIPNSNGGYNKTLPYIPPNHTTLQAFRALLFERRNLIDTAGNYFNPAELRRQLYNIKRKGENPLMNVLGKADKLAFLHKKAETGTKIDEVEGPLQKRIKKEPVNTSRLQDYQDNMESIKQSREFQQLQARFQAVFTWPALLSTVRTPDIDALLPANIMDVGEDMNEASAGVNIASSAKQTKQKGLPIKRGPFGRVPEVMPTTSDVPDQNPLTRLPVNQSDTIDLSNTSTSFESAASVANADSDGDSNNGDLTELEAINKMVDKIAKEYLDQRPKVRGYKKKPRNSEAFKTGCQKRERTRILKRLGLHERVMELEKQETGAGLVGEKAGPDKDGMEPGEEVGPVEEKAGSTEKGDGPTEWPGGKEAELDRIQGVAVDNEEGAGSPVEKAAGSGVIPGTSGVADGTETTAALPVKKRRGRPCKNTVTTADPPRRSTRVLRRPSSLEASYNASYNASMDVSYTAVDDGEIPHSGYQRYMRNVPDEEKNKRLKAMVPEKMSNLLSKIPDIPLLNTSNQVSDNVTNGHTEENLKFTHDPGVGTEMDMDVTHCKEDYSGHQPASLSMPQLEVFTATDVSHCQSMEVGDAPITTPTTPTTVQPSVVMGTPTTCDRSGGSRSVMVAVPVTVDGVTQIACVPVQVSSDGKFQSLLGNDVTAISSSGDGTLTPVSNQMAL